MDIYTIAELVGLCQVQNSFVPDSQNVARCSYLLHESSSTQLSYVYEAVAMSLYNIIYTMGSGHHF